MCVLYIVERKEQAMLGIISTVFFVNLKKNLLFFCGKGKLHNMIKAASGVVWPIGPPSPLPPFYLPSLAELLLQACRSASIHVTNP